MSAIQKLTSLGIRTTADLDAYILANPQADGSFSSRYGTLKKLVGEQAADGIMRELEVASWDMGVSQ